jgi:tyrosinase
VLFQGQFLPYHRYFVASYEKALREECGFAGAQPYWDWTLDTKTTADFVKSPIFDTTVGFGGNGAFIPYNASDPNQPSAPLGDVPGRTGGGCVTDGPFKNMTLRLGPGPDLSGSAGPVCLRRDFSPLIGTKFDNKSNIAYTLSQPDYGHFQIVFDGDMRTVLPPNFASTSIHTGGHWSIGGSFGTITDLYISPSDPLFWLHHSNLDRVFWSWQTRNLPARFFDMSGPLAFGDYDNAVAGNTTLDYVIDVGTINVNTTVGSVMNIQGGTLCYGFDALL